MANLDLQRGTYAAAETLLRKRDSRIIGHNTTLHRTYGGALAVRYHSTDVVTLTADGWLTMRTGGWDTVTTWSRINALLPGRWSVWSRKGSRYLYSGGRRVTPYVDGLSIHADTGRVGMGSDVLLTADDVAAIIAAADTAEADREAKRAARLLREHPTVGGPRTHTRSEWNRRAYGCARCTAEESAERDAKRAALAAEHEAGTHPTDYSGRAVCPWDCPETYGASRASIAT